MEKYPDVNAHEISLKMLYRVGAIAAIAAVAVFRRNWGAELMLSQGFGIFNVPKSAPIGALEWFRLLQNEPFVGLSLLGLFDLVNYALVGLIFLALFAALHKSGRSAILLALTGGLVGVTIYLVSNPALNMITLSKRYALAGADELLASIVLVGEALLAFNNPAGPYHGSAYHISILLVLIAGLLYSIVMLRGEDFNKWTAWIGLLANGIYLLYVPAMLFLPDLLWLPPSLAAPFRMAWYILIAVRLFKLE